MGRVGALVLPDIALEAAARLQERVAAPRALPAPQVLLAGLVTLAEAP